METRYSPVSYSALSLVPSHSLHLVNQPPFLKHLLYAWYQTKHFTHITYNLTTNLGDWYDYSSHLMDEKTESNEFPEVTADALWNQGFGSKALNHILIPAYVPSLSK